MGIVLLVASVSSGDNRIWLDDTKIDGKPVRFIFDSGANAIALSSDSVRRLGLKSTKARSDGFAFTDTHAFSWDGNSFQTTFLVFSFPANANGDFDGIMGWAPISSSIVRIDANALKIESLTEAPNRVSNWTQFRLMTNFGTLDLEVPQSDGTMGIISIDTGSDCGLALSASRWLEWKKNHPRSPATIKTYMTHGGLISEEESWADKIRIGPLVLTDVPIMEDHIAVATQWGTKQNATLGLAALSRLDIVVDGIRSIGYMRARTTPPRPYPYNRLGADFVPTDSDTVRMAAKVVTGSPAYDAGIRNGDVLLRVDNIKVVAWTDDWESRFRMPAGTKLSLELQRAGTNFETTAILREILHPNEHFQEFSADDPSHGKTQPNADATEEMNDLNETTQIAQEYYNKGDKERKAGNWDGALAEYTSAIQADSKFAGAYGARGYIEQVQNNIDSAILDYDKAIELNPGFAKAYGDRGSAEQAKGNMTNALADYDKAIELKPDWAEAYVYRGCLEQAMGRMDMALSDDDRAIDLDPNSAVPYCNRSGVEATKGDLARAEADCAKGVGLNSSLAIEAAQIFKVLGWSRHDRLEYTNALSDFQQACKLNPTDDYARFGLWLCTSMLGNSEEAARELGAYMNTRGVEGSNDWPGQVGRFLAGQITEQELLAAAESPDIKKDEDQHCEAYFYIGSKDQIAGDKSGAAAFFKKCLATGVESFNEYQSAKAELRVLDNANQK